MKSLLSANRRAQMLAHSLWEFFRFRLYCTTQQDDGQPSTHHIDLPTENEPLRIQISLRQTRRQEEALVHELLHANLIPLGYPTFRIWEPPDDDRKWRLAGGIINSADHIIMLPTFLSFGYSASRFFGPGNPDTSEERRIRVKVANIAINLQTPQGYAAEISSLLGDERIKFESICLANLFGQDSN
jgi:hypothetical protein